MIYNSYYILVNKEDEHLFLTEDKTYTSNLDGALKFQSEGEAQNLINIYKENEADEYYTGDFYVGNNIEIKKVKIIISWLL